MQDGSWLFDQPHRARRDAPRHLEDFSPGTFFSKTSRRDAEQTRILSSFFSESSFSPNLLASSDSCSLLSGSPLLYEVSC